jgi:hypothetical protein
MATSANVHRAAFPDARALPPADARIQQFLDDHLRDVCPDGAPRLPAQTLSAVRAGQAREWSFPPGEDYFESPHVKSYRVAQGVLHNPRNDRRTTKGVFHIAGGGLPIPTDKIAVPKPVFAALLRAALQPPPELLALPSSPPGAPELVFVSLLLRPLICPATPTHPEKSMETRFFVPGSLVSNIDFVECIFGNAGDPSLPENDAALDVMHWSGHSGCVILAPHLTLLRKMDLGLPHSRDATARQRRDGMCWDREDDVYNGGSAFKVTCRDTSGVIVTLIADNYFGYCKKEVKTQIGFAANLYGMSEEEHAGGAVAYPAYVLGEEFLADRTVHLKPATLEHALRILGDVAERQPGGHATDRRCPGVLYVPETAEFNVREGWVRWEYAGARHSLPLRTGEVYILPSGYQVRLEKQLSGSAWRLVGTRPDGALCHKPCTVSGGGKSEISKSIADVLLKGPIFVREFGADLDEVEKILARDFSRIYRRRRPDSRTARPILSTERSLGSVIKLLTPSGDYVDEHNQWVRHLPQTIRQLVFTVKRYYRPEWGAAWREHFSVDRINGFLGHELKFDGQKLVSNYLRVGFDPDGSWRIYKLRPDFHPADKVQVEDDITVSAVVPADSVPYADPAYNNPSIKLVANCEAMLFQRPDDAIHRGMDKQAEADIATPGTFLSNFEPLTREQATAIVNHVAEFDKYSDPMKRLLTDFVNSREGSYVVSSAHPRIVDGAPSKNQRYLQKRPDLVHSRETYVAEMGVRLDRGAPPDSPVFFPVNAVLPGRRNNPPDLKAGTPPLAVYNPIHYQELPELFMEFVSSLTGKSPSTTGFGSEGALTKGPFNALLPVVDLNNALVSMILTKYAAFTTSAGYIGPGFRVDHDVSMLVPEVWCRMQVQERDPEYLIRNGYLEKVGDLEFEGRVALASRLGYRITNDFADQFLGRIFEMPDAVFPDEMLRPEMQDLAMFVSGVDAIVESQRRVAEGYFEDGSIDSACPPLKALLHIMAGRKFGDLTLDDPRLRAMFTREAVLASDWYTERLRHKQTKDAALWERHLRFIDGRAGDYAAARGIAARVNSSIYLTDLVGTIGADPSV